MLNIRSRFNGILNRLFVFFLKIKHKNLIIGKNSRIDWSSYIDISNNSCEIGDNVTIQSFPKGYHVGIPFPASLLIDVKGAKIKIGNNSSLHGCYIHAQNEIRIGNKCAIASGVNIIDSNGHRLNSPDRNKHRDTPKKILIGDNVWIGVNSVILKGTVIGNNSVVSAGSIVKGNFPENSLISGNPAIIIDKLNLTD